MKWIKIEDEEPQIGRNVIAVGTWWGEINGAGEDEYMGIGVWMGDCVKVASGTYSTEILDISHWMYIPSHPED